MQARSVVLCCGATGLALAVLFHALLGIASYTLMYGSRHAPSEHTPDTCCHLPLLYKDVSFQSPHGIEPDTYVNIAGQFFPHFPEAPQCGGNPHLCNIYNVSNNNATLVVVHGHGANIGFVDGNGKSMFQKAILPFLMAGYNVLAIELRNHGRSGDALPVSLGKYEYLDILAGVEWLVEQIKKGELPNLDASRIGVYGESMGGYTVLMAAAKDDKSYISAIACESAYMSAKDAFVSWIPAHIGGQFEVMGFDFSKSEAFLHYMWRSIIMLFPYEFKDIHPQEVISTIHCPILITHGHTDNIIPFSHSGEIIKHAQNRTLCGRKRDSSCIVRSAFYKGGHVESYHHPAVVTDMIDFMEDHV